ncbi:hypothetical protein [Paenibacillus sp. GXUN7292]|uniref:hypothetical protein n=1 Tax=Paenibacillus sp. GXUN7292 TaxID=3422499 RepID=UPI003D7E0E27
MNDILKNKLIEENRSNLVKQYKSMLVTKKVQKAFIVNLYETISYLHDSKGKTNKEMVIELFNSKPLAVINQLIPYLVSKEIVEEANVYLDTDNFREKVEFPFTLSLRAKKFNIITHVSFPSLQFVDSDGNDVNPFINHEVELDRFNHLSKDIYLKGKFVQDYSVSHNAFDYLDKYINVYVTGLLTDEPVPSWVEYLIEGCINMEYSNSKMALFNIFAALDKFIELLNEKIFEYYIVNYNKQIKKFSISSEDRIDVSSFLKLKIKKFGKDNRRIIEKLRDALKEVGINGKTDEFKQMYALITEVEKIEGIRNDIGHGEKVVGTIDVGHVLYTVLTIIFSIIHYQDFEKNDWKKIIV